jgi:protein TonB
MSAAGKFVTEEAGRLPAPQADGRSGTAPAPPVAHGAPAQAPPALQEATPEYDRNPPPEYPRRARQLGIEGTVVLEVRVNPTGGAEEVKIAASSGNSLLDQSALRSVAAWRFKPARRGDLPVAAWVQVPIRYTLKPSGGSPP